MKCIQCDRDVNRKDRTLDPHNPRCPNCSHTFVTEPTEDHVTDRMVLNAVGAVSHGGVSFYLRRHLYYELLRRHLWRIRRSRRWALLFFALAVAAVIVHLIWDMPALLFFALVFGVLTVVKGVDRFRVSRPVETMLDRWVEVNPDEKLLTGAPRPSVKESDTESELGAASFDHLLICDRNEYVDFLLANLFHFHFSCPVLGISKYPQDVFPDMVARLKTNPNLRVFLVHDLTPDGLDLARKVKQDPQWFGDTDVEIIDLGLLPEHRPMVDKLLAPLSDITAQEAGGGKERQWTELTVVSPDNLISLCAAGLREGRPFPTPKRSVRRRNGMNVYVGDSFGGGDGYG